MPPGKQRTDPPVTQSTEKPPAPAGGFDFAAAKASRPPTPKEVTPAKSSSAGTPVDVDAALERFGKRVQDAQVTPPAYKYRKQILWGPPGVGKTSMLASAAFDPRTAPLMLLDFEGGAVSALGVPPELCTPIFIRDWDDLTDAHAYLANATHPYKSVGIDSATETHIYSLMDVVDRAFQAREAGEKGEKRADNLKIHQDDYGRALMQMRRIVRAFKALDMNVFFTAMSKQEEEPREGYVKKPFLFGSFADESIGLFEASIYMEVAKSDVHGEVQEKRNLILQNVPAIRARVKTPWGKVVPNIIKDVPLKTGMTVLLDTLGMPKEA